MSKIIARIESELGYAILKRSSKGFAITPEAIHVTEMAKSIIDTLEMQNEKLAQPFTRKSKALTFMSRVFMNTCFAPELYNLTQQEFPYFRLRFIDGSPKETEQLAKEGVIDITLALRKPDYGKNWLST